MSAAKTARQARHEPADVPLGQRAHDAFMLAFRGKSASGVPFCELPPYVQRCWVAAESAERLNGSASVSPSEKPLPDAPGWWVRRIHSSRTSPASTSLVYIQIPIAPPYADAWYGPLALPWVAA